MKNMPIKIGVILVAAIACLISCSKKQDPNPPGEEEELQLQLTADETDVEAGKEITLTVMAGGQSITDADIYIDNQKVTGYQHAFDEPGAKSIQAKKAGYKESDLVAIDVYRWNVYVAGYESNGAIDVAKIWKGQHNDEEGDWAAQNLADEGYHAAANAITISDGDVYVAGYQNNGSQRTVAKLWKNGEADDLSDGTGNADATAIAVSGSDVYVAGYEDHTKVVAKLWKNGVAQDLSDGTENTWVYATAVSGDDVYAAGQEGNFYKAKMWENGVVHDL